MHQLAINYKIVPSVWLVRRRVTDQTTSSYNFQGEFQGALKLSIGVFVGTTVKTGTRL